MASHYATVERAIVRLADASPTPDLAALAAEAGMSPTHFQKVFTAWAGVSPKRFAQALALARARRALEAHEDVLAATLAAGLSSPSRLHDLFVTATAMTPGAWRRRGEGLTLRWAWCDSPFGDALVVTSDRGVCALSFACESGRAACFDEVAARWSSARLVEDAAGVRASGGAVFEDGAGPPRVHLHGTPWQLEVWEALLRIPPGAVVSYDGLARALGRPTAARAVAGAVADNVIGWLVPCHRVIRRTGAVSGYRWGPPRKLAMLGVEALAGAGAAEREASAV